MNMFNTTYNSTEDMINKLQELEGKTKLKLYKNIKKYSNEIKLKMFKIKKILFLETHKVLVKTIMMFYC